MTKLKITELEVQSFATSLSKLEKQTVNGGAGSGMYWGDPSRKPDSHFCPEARNTNVPGDCGGNVPDAPAVDLPLPEENDPDRVEGWDDMIFMVGAGAMIVGAGVALTFFGGGVSCLAGAGIGGGMAAAQ